MQLIISHSPATFHVFLSIKQFPGFTEIWTRIAGFRALSANHYTMKPIMGLFTKQY